MADNVQFQSGTLASPAASVVVATDEATYSGDTAKVQIVRLVHVSGAEGAKTISEIADATNGLDVDVTRLPALVAGTANIGDVDVLTVPAPLSTAGGGTEATALRVTLASDSTGLISVDDNGSSLTVDQATAANLKAQVQIIDSIGDSAMDDANNAVRVNVVAGGAGDGAILDGVSAAIRGTVFDYTNSNPLAVRLTDTTGDYVGAGGGTQYDEDTVSSAADKITMAGVVRKDTAATLVDLDGDRTQLQVDASGRLHVNGSGVTQPVSAASLPLPTGAATSALQTQPGVDIGDVTVNNAAGAAAVNIQDGGNSITVDGTVAVSGSVDTELPAAASIIAENTAAPTAPSVYSFPLVFDGTNWDRAPGTSVDGALVNLGANNDVTVTGTVTANLAAGTNNIGDVDVLTVPADPFGLNADVASSTGSMSAKLRFIAATGIPITSIAAGDTNIGNVDIVTMPNVTLAAGTNTNEVVGDAAHDAAASGNPVLIAASHETAADSAPTNRLATVTDGDVTRLSATDGALFVIPGGPQQWKARLTGLIAADTTVKAAPGAGLSLYITSIVFSIGAATASSIMLEESTTTPVFGPHYLEAVSGRGIAVTFGTPIKIAANTLLSASGTGATTATLDVYGFTAPG